MRAMFDRIAGFYDVMNSVMTAGPAPRAGAAAPPTSPRSGPATACSTSRPAPATSRSSSRARVGAGRRGHRLGLLGGDARALREPQGAGGAGADHVRVGQRDGAALRRRRVRRRDGRLRRAQLLRPRPRACARWRASCAPAARVVVLEITTPTRPPLSTFYRLWFDRVVPVIGRVAGDPEAYEYLPNSVKRFPGPHELAAKMDACGMDVRYVLTAGGIIALHVGTQPRDDDAAPAQSVAAIVQARRAARPAAARARRGAARRARRRATARCSPSTPARRSPPAASGCGRCSCCSPPGPSRGDPAELVACARGRRARPSAHARPRRRARRARAAPRRADGLGAGRRGCSRRRPATCCSRARSRSWPRPGALESVRALSRASSALAEGELLQREDAWNAAVAGRSLPLSLRAEDRAPVRGGVQARRARGAARDAGHVAALGAFGRRDRPGLPAARRRPRRLRAGRSRHRQASRDRPARRHRHAAADPRARARSASSRRSTCARSRPRSRRPSCASASRRPARSPARRRRARWRSSTRRRRGLAALELEDGQRRRAGPRGRLGRRPARVASA